MELAKNAPEFAIGSGDSIGCAGLSPLAESVEEAKAGVSIEEQEEAFSQKQPPDVSRRASSFPDARVRSGSLARRSSVSLNAREATIGGKYFAEYDDGTGIVYRSDLSQVVKALYPALSNALVQEVRCRNCVVHLVLFLSTPRQLSRANPCHTPRSLVVNSLVADSRCMQHRRAYRNERARVFEAPGSL